MEQYINQACESGAERKKRRAVVFASGKTGKSE